MDEPVNLAQKLALFGKRLIVTIWRGPRRVEFAQVHLTPEQVRKLGTFLTDGPA